jgi:hypothetical protein
VELVLQIGKKKCDLNVNCSVKPGEKSDMDVEKIK